MDQTGIREVDIALGVHQLTGGFVRRAGTHGVVELGLAIDDDLQNVAGADPITVQFRIAHQVLDINIQITCLPLLALLANQQRSDAHNAWFVLYFAGGLTAGPDGCSVVAIPAFAAVIEMVARQCTAGQQSQAESHRQQAHASPPTTGARCRVCLFMSYHSAAPEALVPVTVGLPRNWCIAPVRHELARRWRWICDRDP